jgi:hypothetical protein
LKSCRIIISKAIPAIRFIMNGIIVLTENSLNDALKSSVYKMDEDAD